MDIYEIEREKLIQEDKLRVQKILSPNDLTTDDWNKIKYQIDNLGFSEEEVLEQVFNKDNWYYKFSVLRKATEKQAYQERTLIKFLDDNSTQISSLINLPNSGKDALWIRDNSITKIASTTRIGKSTKSIDFSAKTTSVHPYPDTDVYGIAKRTVGQGGSQDNQHHDAIKQLEQAVSIKGSIIVAVLDGNYYDKVNQLTGLTVREQIASEFSHCDHIVITDYHNFDNNIKAAVPS